MHALASSIACYEFIFTRARNPIGCLFLTPFSKMLTICPTCVLEKFQLKGRFDFLFPVALISHVRTYEPTFKIKLAVNF